MPGLAVFGGRQAYRRFVDQAIGEGHDSQYYKVQDQQILGTEGFVTHLREHESPELVKYSAQSLSSAVKVVATALMIDPATLTSRNRSWTISYQRTLAAFVLVRRKGNLVSEVARQLRRDVSTMSTMVSRFAGRLEGSVPLQQSVEGVSRLVSS